MNAGRLTLVAASVLAGLSAGFFFAYHVSVTRALAEVDDTTYVVTFQAINDTVRNAAFGIVFFGTIPMIGIALAIHRRSTTTRWLLAAGLGLFVSCFLITVAGNVPLNDELAEYADLTAATAATARAEFESDWNRLNLARTFASIGGFALLAAASAAAPRIPPAPSGTAAGGTNADSGRCPA